MIENHKFISPIQPFYIIFVITASSGPQTGVVIDGPVPQKKLELTIPSSSSTPGLAVPAVTINVPQPKIRHQPIPREMHHRVEETLKVKQGQRKQKI